MAHDFDRMALERLQEQGREADQYDRELRWYTVRGVRIQAFCREGAEYLWRVRRGGGRAYGIVGEGFSKTCGVD